MYGKYSLDSTDRGTIPITVLAPVAEKVVALENTVVPAARIFALTDRVEPATILSDANTIPYPLALREDTAENVSDANTVPISAAVRTD